MQRKRQRTIVSLLLPLAFLNTNDSLTVPLLLEQLNGERQTDTTTLIAGTLISTIPTVIS